MFIKCNYFRIKTVNNYLWNVLHRVELVTQNSVFKLSILKIFKKKIMQPKVPRAY